MYQTPQQIYYLKNKDKMKDAKLDKKLKRNHTKIETECFKITYVPKGINPFVSIPKK